MFSRLESGRTSGREPDFRSGSTIAQHREGEIDVDDPSWGFTRRYTCLCHMADFWAVFGTFNSRFDRWAVRWGSMAATPGHFGPILGVRGSGPELNKYVFDSFQKAAALCHVVRESITVVCF